MWPVGSPQPSDVFWWSQKIWTVHSWIWKNLVLLVFKRRVSSEFQLWFQILKLLNHQAFRPSLLSSPFFLSALELVEFFCKGFEAILSCFKMNLFFKFISDPQFVFVALSPASPIDFAQESAFRLSSPHPLVWIPVSVIIFSDSELLVPFRAQLCLNGSCGLHAWIRT